MGYKVIYYSAPKLFAKLKMTKADGSYIKEIAKIIVMGDRYNPTV